MSEFDDKKRDAEDDEIVKRWNREKHRIEQRAKVLPNVGILRRAQEIEYPLDEGDECSIPPDMHEEDTRPAELVTPPAHPAANSRGSEDSQPQPNTSSTSQDTQASSYDPDRIPSSSNDTPRIPRAHIGSPSPRPMKQLDDDYGPERSAVLLLRNIQAGSMSAEDLDKDERRVIVQVLRDQGRTQDEIAALLSVSRRTIVSDCKWLKDKAVDFLRHMDTYDLAAEVYQIGMNCVNRALAAEKFRSVSQIMKDMTEILQSMGVVYKAPMRSRVAAMVGHVPVQQGFTQYISGVGNEKDKVVGVIGEMMNVLREDPKEANPQ